MKKKKVAKTAAKLLAAILALQASLATQAQATIQQEPTINTGTLRHFQREIAFHQRELERQRSVLDKESFPQVEEVTRMLENLLWMKQEVELLEQEYEKSRIPKRSQPNFKQVTKQAEATMQTLAIEYIERIKLEVMFLESNNKQRQTQAARELIKFLRDVERLRELYIAAYATTERSMIAHAIELLDATIIDIGKKLEKPE